MIEEIHSTVFPDNQVLTVHQLGAAAIPPPDFVTLSHGHGPSGQPVSCRYKLEISSVTVVRSADNSRELFTILSKEMMIPNWRKHRHQHQHQQLECDESVSAVVVGE